MESYIKVSRLSLCTAFSCSKRNGTTRVSVGASACSLQRGDGAGSRKPDRRSTRGGKRGREAQDTRTHFESHLKGPQGVQIQKVTQEVKGASDSSLILAASSSQGLCVSANEWSKPSCKALEAHLVL